MLFRSLEIDIERRRIALSCRMSDQPGENTSAPRSGDARASKQANHPNQKSAKQQQAVAGNTLGALLLAAQKKKKR